jgi:glucokinase
MKPYCFGIDVGGTTVKCGFFKTDGTLVEKWEIPTRKEDHGVNVLPDIGKTILDKMAEKGITAADVEGAGVGIPGPVRENKIPYAVNLGWGAMDIAKELGELTGLKIKAGNDANVAALGEMWKGGAEGHSNVIVVTLGTGVGGGIIIDGRIVEGAHGAGGEIGHAHVEDDIHDPCGCGNFGCLEQVASATGIARLAREELERMDPSEETPLRLTDRVTAKTVFDAYKTGDKASIRIVERFAKYLGTTLSVFACVVDPEVIVLGGGVSKAGQVLVDVVENYFLKTAFPACRETKIVLAELGNDAGIYGSARLVLG